MDEKLAIFARSRAAEKASAMSDLSIKLEGYPEKVQRIADAIENAFPELMVWIVSEDGTDGISIKIEGYELQTMPMQAPRPMAA